MRVISSTCNKANNVTNDVLYESFSVEVSWCKELIKMYKSDGTRTEQSSSSGHTSKASREVPATFIGRLHIGTPAGYRQQLQVGFEPSVIADVEPLCRVENTISMNTINVRANKMTAPANSRKAKDKGDLDPYFVNEATTITVGASCDHDGVEGPIDESPNVDDFVTSRTASKQTTKGGNLQIGYPLAGQGAASYSRTTGISETLVGRSIGLEPQFGASSNGCQTWKYKIKDSYRTALQFSSTRPPVHSAKFYYDGRSNDNFPKHLIARIEADFTKNVGFRHLIAKFGLKNTLTRVYIRHISLDLEARIKRMKPEDYFRIPGPFREGATLEATVSFKEVEINSGELKQEKPNTGEEEINRLELKREKRNAGEDTDFTPHVRPAEPATTRTRRREWLSFRRVSQRLHHIASRYFARRT